MLTKSQVGTFSFVSTSTFLKKIIICKMFILEDFCRFLEFYHTVRTRSFLHQKSSEKLFDATDNAFKLTTSSGISSVYKDFSGSQYTIMF